MYLLKKYLFHLRKEITRSIRMKKKKIVNAIL